MEPGTIIDRFEVLRELGSGGMATVYAVKHTQLGSQHALKVLLTDSPELALRLRTEGRLQAGLRHPHIVAVHDVIEVDGNPGLVMELVEGVAMDAWIDTNDEADHATRLALAGQVIGAVAHAHSQGMIHRDLKPANVLITDVAGRPFAKVADFGLAKHTGDDLSRTRTGMPMGTPRYMAPEQIKDAKRVDERADVFALGCLIHELWTGKPAFDAESIGQVFVDIVAGELPDLDGLPEGVAAAVRGALNPDPELRLQSCEALLTVLEGGAPPTHPIRTVRRVVPAPPPTAAPDPSPAEPAPAPGRRWVIAGLGSATAAAIALALLLALGCAGVAAIQLDLFGGAAQNPKRERPAPAPAPSPSPRVRPVPSPAPPAVPSPTPSPRPSPAPTPSPSPSPKPDKDKDKDRDKDRDKPGKGKDE